MGFVFVLVFVSVLEFVLGFVLRFVFVLEIVLGFELCLC